MFTQLMKNPEQTLHSVQVGSSLPVKQHWMGQAALTLQGLGDSNLLVICFILKNLPSLLNACKRHCVFLWLYLCLPNAPQRCNRDYKDYGHRSHTHRPQIHRLSQVLILLVVWKCWALSQLTCWQANRQESDLDEKIWSRLNLEGDGQSSLSEFDYCGLGRFLRFWFDL